MYVLLHLCTYLLKKPVQVVVAGFIFTFLISYKILNGCEETQVYCVLYMDS